MNVVRDILDKQLLDRNGRNMGKADGRAMATYFDFTQRQSSYYRQAAEMLGLVEMKANRYFLTSVGRSFVSLATPDRIRAMTELLFKHRIMQGVLKRLISSPEKPVTREDITATISRMSALTGTTLPRRAQTILSWFRWMQTNFGLVVVEKEKVWLATRFPNLNRFSH